MRDACIDSFIGKALVGYERIPKESEWDDDGVMLVFADGSVLEVSSAGYDGSDIEFSVPHECDGRAPK